MRLCKLINRESNILVLDEPTNHLDVDAKDELKEPLWHIRAVYLWSATNQSSTMVLRLMCGTAESGQHVFNH